MDESRTEKESRSKDKDSNETIELPDEPTMKDVEMPQASNKIKEKSKITESKNTQKGNTPTNTSQKKKVRVVGTSNIKFISPGYLGGSEFFVTKITRYTLKETKEYFSGLNPDEKQDVFILQSLCNDINIKTPESCAVSIEDIVGTLSSKFKESKILVSMGLPRSDVHLNTKIEKTNILLKEKFAGKEQTTVCDNGNLFYRREAQRGVLNEDGIHMSGMGTSKLAKNLKGTLFDLFDIPWVVYETKQDERYVGQKDAIYRDDYQQINTQTDYKTRDWNERQNRNDNRRTHDSANGYFSKQHGKDRDTYRIYSYDKIKDTQHRYNWDRNDGYRNYQSQSDNYYDKRQNIWGRENDERGYHRRQDS